MTNSENRWQGPNRRRRRFFIHRIQTTYAAWLGALLFLYSLLVFSVAFLAPYIGPMLTLAWPSSLQERELASAQFLMLAETVWPAIIALTVGSAVFSVYLTHRLAGPLYRLEQSAREFCQGNLALRIRLRQGDELQVLASLTNEAMTNLDKALIEIHERHMSAAGALRSIQDRIQTQQGPDRQTREGIERALSEGERIEAVLKRFRLSDSV